MAEKLETPSPSPEFSLYGDIDKLVGAMAQIKLENWRKQMSEAILQWEKEFFDAGFDTVNNRKLDKFDAKKLLQLEKNLDILIAHIESLADLERQKKEILLEQMQGFDRRAEGFETHIPVIELTLDTKVPIDLRMGNLESFDPKNTEGKRIDIRTLSIAGALANDATLNLRASMLLDNPKTPENEGIKRVADYLEKTYFKDTEHAKMLKKLGIDDIHHITPRQAVQLASYIPIERITYSQKQISGSIFESNTEREINDSTPIDRLFDWGQDKSGNGVCRNYASVAVGVLEALKMLQTPEKSLIHNTYGLFIGSSDVGENIPGMVNFHAWNGYINISENSNKNGSYIIDGLVLDSTWADSSGYMDPSRVDQNGQKLDYTRERFFTLVQQFENTGLLSPEKYIPQLIEQYKQAPLIDKNGPLATQEYPTRLFIGYRICSLLDNIQKNSGLSPAIQEFLNLFLVDIDSYGKCIPRLFNSGENSGEKQREYVFVPLFKCLGSIVNICDTYDLEGEKEKYIRVSGDVLNEYRGSYYSYRKNDYYIFLADRVRDWGALVYQGGLLRQAIEQNPDNYGDIPGRIYQRLSPDGKTKWRELFPDVKDTENTKNEIQKRIKTRFGCFFSIGYGITEEKSTTFLEVFERVLQSLPPEELFPRGSIVSIKPDEEASIDLGGINLHLSMTDTDIREEITASQSRRDQWQEIIQIAPCKINFTARSISRDKIESFLKNTQEYFRITPLHILVGKEINIMYSDSSLGNSNATVSIDHFINGEFERITEIITAYYDDSKDSTIGDRQRNLRKKFHDLTDVFDFVKIDITKEDEYEVISSYYDAVYKSLMSIHLNEEGTFTTLKHNGFGLYIHELSSSISSGDIGLLKKGYPYYLLQALWYGGSQALEKNVSSDGKILNNSVGMRNIFSLYNDNMRRIRLKISETKSGNARIDKAREQLRQMEQPIKITSIKDDKFFSGETEIYILEGDQIVADPDPKGIVKRDGTIILYTNNTPEEVQGTVLMLAKKYALLIEKIKKAKKYIPPNVDILFQSELSEINENVEKTIERLLSILATKIITQESIQSFGKVQIFVCDDGIQILIKSKDKKRQYENTLIFNDKTDSGAEIIRTTIEKIEKNDTKIINIQNNYGVTLNNWFARTEAPDELEVYLEKINTFLSKNSKEYQGFEIKIDPNKGNWYNPEEYIKLHDADDFLINTSMKILVIR